MVESDKKYYDLAREEALDKETRNIDKATDVLSFPALLKEGVKDEQLIVEDLTKEKLEFTSVPKGSIWKELNML